MTSHEISPRFHASQDVILDTCPWSMTQRPHQCKTAKIAVCVRNSQEISTNICIGSISSVIIKGGRTHSSCLHSSSNICTCSNEQGIQNTALTKRCKIPSFSSVTRKFLATWLLCVSVNPHSSGQAPDMMEQQAQNDIVAHAASGDCPWGQLPGQHVGPSRPARSLDNSCSIASLSPKARAGHRNT